MFNLTNSLLALITCIRFLWNLSCKRVSDHEKLKKECLNAYKRKKRRKVKHIGSKVAVQWTCPTWVNWRWSQSTFNWIYAREQFLPDLRYIQDKGHAYAEASFRLIQCSELVVHDEKTYCRSWNKIKGKCDHSASFSQLLWLVIGSSLMFLSDVSTKWQKHF